jgi:hypothetical protein
MGSIRYGTKGLNPDGSLHEFTSFQDDMGKTTHYFDGDEYLIMITRKLNGEDVLPLLEAARVRADEQGQT